MSHSPTLYSKSVAGFLPSYLTAVVRTSVISRKYWKITRNSCRNGLQNVGNSGNSGSVSI